MLGKIKQKLQGILDGSARLAVRLRVTAATMGFLGVALAAAAAASYCLSPRLPSLLYLAGVLVLASGFCDALDGSIARLTGTVSKMGAFMDSTLDRYSDALILGGIVAGGLADPVWGLAALAGSLLVSYARAKAEALGVEMSGVGLAERAERLLIIGLASFLQVLSLAVVAVAALTHVTVVQRALHFRRALSGGRG